MNQFKKQFLIFLFALSAGLFITGSANAQTWSAVYSFAPNPCAVSGEAGQLVTVGQQGRCQCNPGYTFGTAKATNCTMDGFVAGCWNPSTGKCNTCGSGGTVALGSYSCFNNGQSNQGGTDPNQQGISCTGTGGSTGTSTQCVSSGTSTGGFSTN